MNWNTSQYNPSEGYRKPIEVKVNVVGECGNALENAEVSLVGTPHTLNTNSDGTAIFPDVELGMTLDNELHLMRRSVDVLVNYKGAVQEKVIDGLLDNNQLEGTIVVDLAKHIPERHKITFAGIVQLFEDGPASSGNSKKEQPFEIVIGLVPGQKASGKKISMCLAGTEARLSLSCDLKNDYDDNPHNNTVYCNISSAVQRGPACNNLDDDMLVSGTEKFERKPGERVWNIGNRDMDDAGYVWDDNMRYKGWLIHDFDWTASFDLPATKNEDNTALTVKQVIKKYAGINDSRTDTTQNNNFKLTWGDRVR